MNNILQMKTAGCFSAQETKLRFELHVMTSDVSVMLANLFICAVPLDATSGARASHFSFKYKPIHHEKKKYVSRFPQNLVSTLIIIRNVSSNHHIRVISSCVKDHVTLKTENSALIPETNYTLLYIHIENSYFES